MIEQAFSYMAVIWVGLSYLQLILNHFKITALNKWLCLRCLTFILTTLITKDICVGAMASLMAHIFDTQLNNIRI